LFLIDHIFLTFCVLRPPGTGKVSIGDGIADTQLIASKSYTGVELLRVLIKNKVRPILMIALTNHALDHLLSAALDAGITKQIARLGSRSADEKISRYNIEEMEKVAGRSRLSREFSNSYRDLKDVEKEFVNLMRQYLQEHIASDQIMDYLQVQYPECYDGFYNPVPWISQLHNLTTQADGGAWEHQGANGRAVEIDSSLYAYWRKAEDLLFLAKPLPSPGIALDMPQTTGVQARTGNSYAVLAELDQAEDDDNDDEDDGGDDATLVDANVDPLSLDALWKTDEDSSLQDNSHAQSSLDEVTDNFQSLSLGTSPPQAPKPLDINDLKDPIAFFAHFGYDTIPSPPTTDRPLNELLETSDIWTLSQPERQRLDTYWTTEIRSQLHNTQLREYERLRERHAKMLKRYNEGKDEVSLVFHSI
jgi:hypothetical protein